MKKHFAGVRLLLAFVAVLCVCASTVRAAGLDLFFVITQEPTDAGDVTFDLAVLALYDPELSFAIYSPGAVSASHPYFRRPDLSGQEVVDTMAGQWRVTSSSLSDPQDVLTYTFEVGTFDPDDLLIYSGQRITSPASGSVLQAGEAFEVNWTQGTYDQVTSDPINNWGFGASGVSGMGSIRWASNEPSELNREYIGSIDEGYTSTTMDLRLHYAVDFSQYVPILSNTVTGGDELSSVANIAIRESLETPSVRLTFIPEPATGMLLFIPLLLGACRRSSAC